MSAIIPFGAPDVIKKLQFTEELVEGTLPLNNGAGTPLATVFKSAGLVTRLGKEIAIENNKIRPLGEYDVKAQVKKGEKHTSEIRFQPSDFTLMKYGMLIPIPPTTTPPDPTMAAPNNTVGVSVSMLMSALINGVEKYRIYKGVRFNGITIDISRDDGFNCTMPFECVDIGDWTTAPVFSPAASYAANPSTNVWSGITSGADPLVINGTPYDTTSFTAEFDLGVERFRPNGITTFKYSKSFMRNITLSWNTLVFNNVLVGDLRAYTARQINYSITPAGAGHKELQFLSVKTAGYSSNLEGDSKDFGMEEFSDATPEGGIVIVDT